MSLEIKHYKVLELPKKLNPNVVYYVLDKKTGKVKAYISDMTGVPIPLIDLVSTTNDGKETTLLTQEFTYTDGPQVFILFHKYYKVYSVEVQGQGSLSKTQYKLLAPNRVEILDKLDQNDYVTVTYGTVEITNLTPYYTQAQIDTMFEEFTGGTSSGSGYFPGGW